MERASHYVRRSDQRYEPGWRAVGRFIWALASALLGAHATLVHAAGDRIEFAQAPSGSISALLVGKVDPCNGSVIFPMGTPSVAQDGNEFDITSPFAIADPPGCPSPPRPYEVTAALGNVPDGQYAVAWTAGPVVVRGEFGVAGGALQAPAIAVPTLGPAGVLALVALMIAAGGSGLVRRRESSSVIGPRTTRGGTIRS